jgi:hypothetical protein
VVVTITVEEDIEDFHQA